MSEDFEYITPLKVRVELHKDQACKSEKNPERYNVVFDGKVLEIISPNFKYDIELTDRGVLSDIKEGLKRIEGTIGIKMIKIG